MAQKQHRIHWGCKYHPCSASHPWSKARGPIQGDTSRESRRCLCVSPPAPQRKLWVPSILCRVFMCLRVCECACNCSLAMLERSRGQIHRMVLNWAHNWSKLLLLHWFTDSTQRLHTVWALVISQSNRWLWLISLAIAYSYPFYCFKFIVLNI